MIDRKNGDKPITFEVTIGESWAHRGVLGPRGCRVVTVGPAAQPSGEGDFDHFPRVSSAPTQHTVTAHHECTHAPQGKP